MKKKSSLEKLGNQHYKTENQIKDKYQVEENKTKVKLKKYYHNQN